MFGGYNGWRADPNTPITTLHSLMVGGGLDGSSSSGSEDESGGHESSRRRRGEGMGNGAMGGSGMCVFICEVTMFD